MQTLEGLKKRIKTTNSLKDIVSSMKTLSAVSVGQYEKSSKALDVYSSVIEEAIFALVKDVSFPLNSKALTNQKAIAVIFGSDQGLVGKFNKSIMDFAFDFLEKNHFSKTDTTFIVAGKSLASKVVANGVDIDTLFNMPSSVKIMISVAKKIIFRIMELCFQDVDSESDFSFSKNNLKVFLFFNRKTSSSFSQEVIQLLPLDNNFFQKIKTRKWKSNKIPMFRANSSLLISSFVRQLLFVNIYKAIAQSLASEHFTRMLTMQNAEKNIDEHLEEMNLDYQQRRQTEITNELLDVVSGAEVLNQKK